MQRRDLILATAVSMAFVSCPVFAKQEQDPFEWVLSVSNGILQEIKANPQLHAGDPVALQALVDTRVMACVDFTMMTRMTVGPKWRQASPEERQRLMTGFEKLLIRIYSGALKNVKDHTCELRPTRNRKVKDEMVIRTLLKAQGQPDIGLDYRIYRNKVGEWKIVDVNVEGIWMVENYRSQFASTLNQDGIPGLIRLLEEKSDALVDANAQKTK